MATMCRVLSWKYTLKSPLSSVAFKSGMGTAGFSAVIARGAFCQESRVHGAVLSWYAKWH